MPLPLAILCGILLLALIYSWSLGLIILSVLLLPIYYAVRNVRTELPKGGKWKIRWEIFFQAAFAELILGIMFLLSAGEAPASISVWIMAYLLYMLSTSLCISISKAVQ